MKVAKRRRREGKTDYLKRINLLKGGVPRIVFRKTNKYVLAQYITEKEAKDKIEFGISSKNLLKYGWTKDNQGSLKSISASYLIGILMAKKIINKKLKTPIVDFGMLKVLHKAKPYAFLKGLIDGGLEISCKKETFPSEERIKGEHLKNKISFEEILNRISNTPESKISKDSADEEIKSNIEKEK